jgi:transcriptional regulator
MYIPKAFHVSDSHVLEEFITHNSFATLVSTIDGSLFATHLPLILDRIQSSPGVLLGHVARANPHWRAFDGQQEALAIFHGPHAYISPSWYTTSPAVPTWNYAVVHVYGVPRVVEDDVWLARLVDRLVTLYEAGMPTPWPGVLPAEFKANLLKAIVGFTIEMTRIEGKFKLGQNRPLGDQLGMVHQLEVSADPIAQALGEFTKQQLGRDARAS